MSAHLIEIERLREVLRGEAAKLEVEATYWLPGLRDNLRNPYAHQMHRAFKASAERLRRAVEVVKHDDPVLRRILAEADRDGDFTPV